MQGNTTKSNYRVTDITKTNYPSIRYATLHVNDASYQIVIKIYTCKKREIAQHEMENEVAALKHLLSVNLPNCVGIPYSYNHGKDKLGRPIHYISQIPGCDLADVNWDNIQNAGYDVSLIKRDIFKKVAKTLQIFHNNNIAHRDVKPDNIMFFFDNGVVYLWFIDFGYAEFITNEKKIKWPGTKGYASPELAKRLSYDDRANDIWCFGVTILNMWTLTISEEKTANSIEEYISNIMKYCNHLYSKNQIPYDIYYILSRIFMPEDGRIKMDELVNLLENDTNIEEISEDMEI